MEREAPSCALGGDPACMRSVSIEAGVLCDPPVER